MATTIVASILAAMNGAPDITGATIILRGNGVVAPADIAAYLANPGSKFAASLAGTTGTSTGTGTGTSTGSSFNLTSLLGIAGAAGGVAQLANTLGVGKTAAPTLSRAASATLKTDQATASAAYGNWQTLAAPGSGATPDQISQAQQAYSVAAGKVSLDQQTNAISLQTTPPAKSGIGGIMNNPIVGKVLSTAAAAAADLFFNQTENETENPTVGGGFKDLGAAGAVFLAIMVWLSKMWPMSYALTPTPNVKWGPITFLTGGPGPGTYLAIAAFHHALIVTGAIVAAIGAAAVIAGLKSGGGPITATGTAVANALSSIPDFVSSLPAASLSTFGTGLMLGLLSLDLASSQPYQTFYVPTVQLNATMGASTPLGEHIFYQAPAANSNAPYTVIVTNNNGTNTTGLEFRVDKNGYVIPAANATDQCASNTAACYLPFFQPVLDANGNPTSNVQENIGSFNAVAEVQACTTIANDTSLSVADREAALATCLRNNKNTQFISAFGTN